MADSSLDDFFAKKDKSKKSKKKFTTSDQIVKKLEEGGKKPTDMAAPNRKEKEKIVLVPTSTSSNVTQNVDKREDDEWRDFEEEKEKDYSGLKIQNLQIGDIRDEDYEKERLYEDEDGEPTRPHGNFSGPWKTSSATPAAPVIPVRPETPPMIEEPEDKKEESKTGGVYRPPHARLTPGLPAATKPRHPKIAPEISSELHFPSLSAAADAPKGSKKGGTPDSERGFESVKRGSRTSEEAPNRGPKLDLGNKYNALSYGDMS